MAAPLWTWLRHAGQTGRVHVARLARVKGTPRFGIDQHELAASIRVAAAQARWFSGAAVGGRADRDPVEEINDEFAAVFGQHLGAAPGPGGSDSTQTQYASDLPPLHSSIQGPEDVLPAGDAISGSRMALAEFAANATLTHTANTRRDVEEFARIIRKIDGLEGLPVAGLERLSSFEARRLRGLALAKDARLEVLFAAYGAGEETVLAQRCREVLEGDGVTHHGAGLGVRGGSPP